MSTSKHSNEAEARVNTDDSSVVSPKLTQALHNLGVAESVYRGLSERNIQRLSQLLTEGELKSTLSVRMLNEVSRRDVKAVPKLIGTLSEYSGSWPILQDFLSRLGSDDPYLAAKNAQVVLLPVADLPAGCRIQGEVNDDCVEDGQVSQRHSVRGTSGHVLCGTVYSVFKADSPADSIGFFCKTQALIKIFSAFDPEKVSEETNAETQRRRNREAFRVLQELGEDRVSEDQKASPAVKASSSPLMTRYTEAFIALRAATRQYEQHLAQASFAQELFEIRLGNSKVSADVGRQLMGWFETHIQENPNVPQGIVDAFEAIRDPLVQLGVEREREVFRGLLAYQRLHSYISTAAATGSVLSDLETYASLDQQDPLRLNEAMESAKEVVADALRKSDSGISIQDFGRIAGLQGVRDFRVNMNKRLVTLFADELAKATERFAFVSFTDSGEIQEDCLGDSVPMKRLRQHIYGAKIGIKLGTTDTAGPVLGQADFAAIKQYQFLSRVNKSEENLLASMPVKDFQEMICGVVRALRKTEFFEATLAAEESQEGQTLDRDSFGDFFAEWSPTILSGAQYYLSEQLMLNKGLYPGVEAFDLTELWRRSEDRRLGYVPDNRAQITAELSVGLISKNRFRVFREIEPKVKDYQHRGQHEEEIALAEQLLTHPLVKTTGEHLQPHTLQRTYLRPSEMLMIERLAGKAKEIVPRLSNAKDPRTQELGKRIDLLRYVRTISGGASAPWRDGLKRLNVELRSFVSSIPCEDQDGVAFYDAEQLETSLGILDDNYVKVDTLGEGWLKALKFFCSSNSREYLRQRGFGLVTNETYGNVRSMGMHRGDYISKGLVDAVAELTDDKE